MLHKCFKMVLVLIIAILCTGCSSQQLYATGQAYQRNQCLNSQDQSKLHGCMGNEDITYDQYKHETTSEDK